jgi:hypothetical protein
MGLSDLYSLDPAIILFFLRGARFFLRLDNQGRSSGEFMIQSMTITERDDVLNRGILVGDQSIYERLAPYIPLKLSEENGGLCAFDGTRSRRYFLRLAVHEA